MYRYHGRSVWITLYYIMWILSQIVSRSQAIPNRHHHQPDHPITYNNNKL